MIDPTMLRVIGKVSGFVISMIIVPIAIDYIKDEVKLRQQERWRKREKEEDELQKRLREL